MSILDKAEWHEVPLDDDELRDRFACAALTGLVASVSSADIRSGFEEAADAQRIALPELYADICYTLADAMLQRAKKGNT